MTVIPFGGTQSFFNHISCEGNLGWYACQVDAELAPLKAVLSMRFENKPNTLFIMSSSFPLSWYDIQCDQQNTKNCKMHIFRCWNCYCQKGDSAAVKQEIESGLSFIAFCFYRR